MPPPPPPPRGQKHVLSMDIFIQRLQDKDHNQETEIKHLKGQLGQASGEIVELKERLGRYREAIDKLVERGWEREEAILELKAELSILEEGVEELEKAEKIQARMVEMKRGLLERRKGKEHEEELGGFGGEVCVDKETREAAETLAALKEAL